MTYLIWPFRRRLLVLTLLLVGMTLSAAACKGENCEPGGDNYPECLESGPTD